MTRILSSLLLALVGCTGSHQPLPDGTPPVAAHLPGVPPWEAPPRIEAPPLEACLAAGGELVEMDSVDNNDREDHGELLTLGISRTGVLAAAGADGTLKFWSLDAGFLASVDGSALTYGSEIGRVPITDLAFMDDAAIAGDIRGLVAHMGPDGSFYPVGGATPDVPIRAVAVHDATRRFAHAQPGDTVPLVVRSIDSPDVVEVTTTLEEPNDLAFAPGGELLVAGNDAGSPRIEVRAADDPTVVLEYIGFHGTVPIREITHAREGTVAAAVSEHYLYVLDNLRARGELWIPDHMGNSVDLTPTGAFILSTGADGRLLVHRSTDGAEVTAVALLDPVKVRVDPTGALVLVGTRDAVIHVLSCVGE